MRVILAAIAIGCVAVFSLSLAHFTVNSDFPVYYHAAKTILDPNTTSSSVYVTDTTNKYGIPESVESYKFIYSKAAAYLVAPLALFPYYTAKALVIFVNFICYLISTFIALRINGASGRLFSYPLMLSLLWFPFLHDLRSGQINSLLLFLVSIAVLSSVRGRPGLAGICLGVASSFKLFPIAIAMLLGVRNWRIFAVCALFLSATFLLPGSFDWLPAISNIAKNYSPIYLFSMQYGKFWFYLYVLAVAGITALVTYRSRTDDYPELVSLAIPAVLLVMPVMEYYHSTLLMFSIVSCVSGCKDYKDMPMPAVLISVLFITFSYLFTASSVRFHPIPYLSNTLLLLGLSIMWVFGVWKMHKSTSRSY